MLCGERHHLVGCKSKNDSNKKLTQCFLRDMAARQVSTGQGSAGRTQHDWNRKTKIYHGAFNVWNQGYERRGRHCYRIHCGGAARAESRMNHHRNEEEARSHPEKPA